MVYQSIRDQYKRVLNSGEDQGGGWGQAIMVCGIEFASGRLDTRPSYSPPGSGDPTVGDFFTIFRDYCQTYGYPVLFGGVMLENAGVPVPGETAVLVGGFLASEAGHRVFDIRLVIVGTFVAAVLGDNIGFWVGRRWARPMLKRGRRFLFLTPRGFQMAENYFARFGGWTIFCARFITGLRVVGALAAGTAGMPWLRFLAANAGGAVVWAMTISLLGYYFGEHWHVLERWLGRGGLIALGVVLLVGLIFWHHYRRRDTLLSPVTPSNTQQVAAEEREELKTPLR
jgi:membrane protein DedA with SNARE-associated domain